MFKIETRIIKDPKRKILAQIPFRCKYYIDDVVQIIGWVWVDVVFGRRATAHAPIYPIFLCEFNRGEKFGWVSLVSIPENHIQFDNELEQWRDHSLGYAPNIIPHLFVP